MLNQKAWDEYTQYRREMRFKPLKQMSIKRLQNWLISQGDESIQQQIIDNTIRNGWQGLFELKGQKVTSDWSKEAF